MPSQINYHHPILPHLSLQPTLSEIQPSNWGKLIDLHFKEFHLRGDVHYQLHPLEEHINEVFSHHHRILIPEIVSFSRCSALIWHAQWSSWRRYWTCAHSQTVQPLGKTQTQPPTDSQAHSSSSSWVLPAEVHRGGRQQRLLAVVVLEVGLERAR